MHDDLELEIQRNFDFFQRNVGRYLPAHEGQFALLRNASIAGFYATAVLAEIAGETTYGDEPFSIQQVTTASVDLGFFSHALAHR